MVTNETIKQDLFIVLKGHLDFEFKNYYSLYLIAKDNGPNGGKSSSIRFHVNIIDENDNTPICGKNMFIESVNENLIMKNLLQIKVTDLDSTPSSTVAFSIIKSDNDANHNEWFEINSKTGWLSVIKGILRHFLTISYLTYFHINSIFFRIRLRIPDVLRIDYKSRRFKSTK